MIAITGVSGLLGRLVVEDLLKSVAAKEIVAIVRNPAKVSSLAERGVQVHTADYNDKEAMGKALAGVEKLLLISSSEVGLRAAQHRNVIEAAKEAGVQLIAYTSLLHADTSPLGLAAEHIATENMLKDSGVPFVLLRNGWYTENYTGSVSSALEHGAFIGSVGAGKVSSATRADYAAAAAKVLTLDNQGGKIYELAGDKGWTQDELAAEVSLQSGKSVVYKDMPEADFEAALLSVGLPAGLAAMLADSSTGASKGGLFDDSHQLSKLIGRPTTSLAESVKAAL